MDLSLLGRSHNVIMDMVRKINLVDYREEERGCEGLN